MAFQQPEYHFDRLPQSTVYRFAEMELSQAMRRLVPFFMHTNDPRTSALTLIMDNILPEREYQPMFADAVASPYFNNPNKHDLIVYALYHHQSYKAIQSLFAVGPNTIAQHKWESPPVMYPIFRYWDQKMLKSWNQIKENLNLFGENLTHSLKNQANPEHYDTWEGYDLMKK